MTITADPHALVPDAGKIAVLRSNSLGDYIFTLPALDALRAAYPAAEIVLLAQSWHARFLAGRPGPVDRVEVVPYIDGVCIDPARRGESPRAEIDDFFARMARERFDIALQLYGGGRHSNPFIRRLGARVSAGMKAADAPALDRWIPYVFYQPEVLRYLEAVALVGAGPVTLEPRLRLTADDLREARRAAMEDSRPLAVLHPGGTDPRRRWPAESFAAVGDALAEAGARVAVTGTPAEAQLTGTVVGAMRRKAENLCCRLSLGGLAGLLSLSSLVVSNDTGPLHLARAVGAPTVGIYWVGNYINAGPVTLERHRCHLSWRLACAECGVDCTKASCAHASTFVGDVPAAEVVASALELFGRRQERGGVKRRALPAAV